MATVTKGRTARTKGVSMLPEELEDARTLEALAGIGFSELYHHHLAPQVRVAASLLTEMKSAGVEINRARLRDEWQLSISPEALRELYVAESELILGE